MRHRNPLAAAAAAAAVLVCGDVTCISAKFELPTDLLLAVSTAADV